MDHRPPTSCRLSYKGEVAKKDTRLLSAAFAAGLLEHAMAAGVNIVNAEVLLRERGIEVVEQRNTDIGDFSSLITAEVVTEKKTSIASGTLFGNNMPRLVQKGNCRLESYLDGVLMIFVHRDMPGVIGKVGSIFGRHRVNIAQMSVGRASRQAGRRGGRHSRSDSAAAGRGPGRSPGHARGYNTPGSSSSRRPAKCPPGWGGKKKPYYKQKRQTKKRWATELRPPLFFIFFASFPHSRIF